MNSKRKSNHVNQQLVSPGFTPVAYRLMHPELNVPAEATSVGYYRGKHGGRAIGLILQFADGVRSLKYSEIGQLQDALRPQRQSTVPAGYDWRQANEELFA